MLSRDGIFLATLLDMHYPLYVKVCIGLALVVLLVFALTEAREFFIPFTIAVLLSFILLPVARKIESLGTPRWVASFLSVFLAIIVLASVTWLIYMQVKSFASDLPEIKQMVSGKASQLQKWLTSQFHISRNDQSQWLDKKLSDILDSADVYIIALFTTTGIFITNIFLIPLYTFFMILYRDKIVKFISVLSHKENHGKAFLIMHKISRVAQKYLKGLMFDVSIVFIILTGVFLLFGIKHAILFALLVAICNIIIPYMGVTIGSILPFCMTLLTNNDFGASFGVIAACAAIQFIDNHFINPYIVGGSVRINPLTALLALVAAAMIWGLYGMLLCIPVTGMIKVVCDNIDVLKPYGYIIGHEMEYGRQGKKKMIRKITTLKKQA
jgi:predicted PurR-regulated permease PerM